MAVNLSNTVFSWIGGLISHEQRTGTWERVLVSTQYASSMFVGRSLAHALYIGLFVLATLFLVFIWVRPNFEVDAPAAVIVIVLHLMTVYGMAFTLAGLFLRSSDSWTIQTMLTRALYSLSLQVRPFQSPYSLVGCKL